MASLEVEVLSRKLIKPSNPTPPHLRILGLSLFDQLAPPIYGNVIFYYAGADENVTMATSSERSVQLEKSLSEVLPSFFQFAGRFIKDDVSIDCSDQGVEYAEAQVNCKLSDFLQRGPQIELLHKFLPWDCPPAATSLTSPLMAIQVNTFDCGGLVLGITSSHIISDGTCIGAFINAWAKACRNSINGVLCPSSSFHHDIALHFPARISSEAKAKLPLPLAPKPREQDDKEAKIVTNRFSFDQTVIAKIKESAAKAKGGSVLDIKSTKVVVSLALLWKAFLALAAAKHEYTRDSVLVVAMNLRGKLSLQIPEQSFGNFCVPIIVPFEGNKDKMELYDLMILLSDTIKDTRARVSEARSVEDVSSILIESRRALIEKRDQMAGLMDVYLCSSWSGFPLYEADFGWGKPIWVSASTQPGQGIWLMDANNGDGIEVWVSLKEKDMIEFKRDPDILACLSTQL